jgi:hypothetical protein
VEIARVVLVNLWEMRKILKEKLEEFLMFLQIKHRRLVEEKIKI